MNNKYVVAVNGENKRIIGITDSHPYMPTVIFDLEIADKIKTGFLYKVLSSEKKNKCIIIKKAKIVDEAAYRVRFSADKCTNSVNPIRVDYYMEPGKYISVGLSNDDAIRRKECKIKEDKIVCSFYSSCLGRDLEGDLCSSLCGLPHILLSGVHMRKLLSYEDTQFLDEKAKPYFNEIVSSMNAYEDKKVTIPDDQVIGELAAMLVIRYSMDLIMAESIVRRIDQDLNELPKLFNMLMG